MLIPMPGRSAGFSLVELMITLAVLALLLMIGLPNLSAWLANTQIRTAAEAMQAGLQLARAEALRRNANVRFQLVDSLTAACALSSSGANWVVSLADATGACNIDPSDAVAPQIIQKRSGAEGSPNAVITATGGSAVVFSGLGRVTGAGALTQIDISNPGGGACQTAAGPMRCLRLTVASGGQVRMCDPMVDPMVDPNDPRLC
jgi:type IV fimbrial biogenesis protein FimT